jgi:nitrous oxidase accessory protein NosD
MNSLRTALAIALLAAAAGHAQGNKTFISTSGSDGNSCTTTVGPCKTLHGALAKTSAGGEITFIDRDESSNCTYGQLLINKAITINGSASGGLYSCNAGVAIVVTAGTTDTVILRNLTLHAFAGASGGIQFVSGGLLRVENLKIDGFQFGIQHQSAGRMIVRDTTIAGDPTTSSTGIYVSPPSGTAQVDIENTHVLNGHFGLWAQNGARVSIKGSDFSLGTSNSSAGIHADDVGGAVEVDIDSSVISFFTYGVLSRSSKALVRIKNSTFVGNPSGVYSVGGGQIESFGNNRIVGSIAAGPLTLKTMK